MIGVRSSVFCTSSRIKPPRTTVWPSQTLTLVVTLRELKIGWLITLGVITEAWGGDDPTGHLARKTCWRQNRAAIVDEPLELDHLRDEIEIDRHAIGTDHRLDLQGHPGVARFKISRSRRSDGECRCSSICPQNPTGHPCCRPLSGILRRIKLRRITKFAHDLDHGALAALGRDARRGEQIDALLLVQRPDDDLKLRIGENSAQGRRSRARAVLAPGIPKRSASSALAVMATFRRCDCRRSPETGQRDVRRARRKDSSAIRVELRAGECPGGSAAAKDASDCRC